MVEYDAYVLRNDSLKTHLIWAIAIVFLWRYLKLRITLTNTVVDQTKRSAVAALDVEMKTRDMADFMRSLNNCIQKGCTQHLPDVIFQSNNWFQMVINYKHVCVLYLNKTKQL